MLCACASAPPRPVLPGEGEPVFSSLAEMRIDSSGKEHVIEVLAPTPGYQARVVYIGEAFGEREVYLLMREPDPLYIYSAVQVKQRITTGIESKMPIRLLAQQVLFNFAPDREGYRDAGRAAGRIMQEVKVLEPKSPSEPEKK